MHHGILKTVAAELQISWLQEKTLYKQGCRDGSVDKLLAFQAQRPEFDSQHSRESAERVHEVGGLLVGKALAAKCNDRISSTYINAGQLGQCSFVPPAEV